MKNEKDKELDDLFRSGLQYPYNNEGYVDDDWDALETMLDRRNKRRWLAYLRPVLSVAAALLLLFLAWWVYQPKIKNGPHTIVRVNVEHSKVAPAVAVATNTSSSSKSIKKEPSAPLLISKRRMANNETGTLTPVSRVARGNGNDTNYEALKVSTNASNRIWLAALNPGSTINIDGLKEQDIPANVNFDTPPVNQSAASSTAKANKITVKHSNSFQPRYAISVVGAPDLNGVGSFQESKVGTNLGLIFSAGVSKKFTISTGALYSVKPYITNFSNYHSTSYTFAVDPINVSANCRMLDIPLNLNYLVYNKHQQKLSFGTGLSSYIMLQEDYRFNYAGDNVAGPSYYDVPNSNKYFLGVVNLNATYERKLSSKVGLTVQPYLKVPITNLGYSQVRLQSTGLAFGVTYNLNSFKKPD